MQAVQVSENGGPEVLRIVDLKRPEPAAGEVLVRVLATSINHLDLWVRRGMPGVRLPLPIIPGCDGTGEIVALGEGVGDQLEVGMQVVIEPGYSSGKSKHDLAGNDHLSDDYCIRGEHGDGLDCEYVALEARFVFPLPEGMDPIKAAAVPLVFLTAWSMLNTRACLLKDETVLVLGGASGVGSAAIQIARDLGAHVIATAGSEAKRELCRELGAEHVIDHRDKEWSREVKALTGKRGVDVVFEHVGPATWAGSMACMARDARLVTCGGTTGPEVPVLLPRLFIKNQSVLGSTMGPRLALREIVNKVATGAYVPVVDQVLPLSKVQLAHQLLEDRQVIGKIVLTPGT